MLLLLRLFFCHRFRYADIIMPLFISLFSMPLRFLHCFLSSLMPSFLSRHAADTFAFSDISLFRFSCHFADDAAAFAAMLSLTLFRCQLRHATLLSRYVYRRTPC